MDGRGDEGARPPTHQALVIYRLSLVVCGLAAVAVIITLFLPWYGGAFVYTSRPIGAASFTGFFRTPPHDAFRTVPVTAWIVLGAALLSLGGTVIRTLARSRVALAVSVVGSLTAVAVTVCRSADPPGLSHPFARLARAPRLLPSLTRGGATDAVIAASVALAAATIAVLSVMRASGEKEPD